MASISSTSQTAPLPKENPSSKSNGDSEPRESFFTRHPMIATEAHPWQEYNPATGQMIGIAPPTFTATGKERADPTAADPRSKEYMDRVRQRVEEKKAMEMAAQERMRQKQQEKERRKEEKRAKKHGEVMGV
ncbi:MAG: hypothetical protein MMC33_001033 [Icmadophila ericetorum]|nr:hypothetical protein [Icmadophila ericetorum]